MPVKYVTMHINRYILNPDPVADKISVHAFMLQQTLSNKNQASLTIQSGPMQFSFFRVKEHIALLSPKFEKV